MDSVLVLCRLLHYGSAMVLFGVSVFQGVLAPRMLASRLDRPLVSVATAAALTLVLTSVAWLLVTSGEMGDGWSDVWSPESWAAVLFDTEFGHVWLWRLGLAALLCLLLIAGRIDRWRIVAALSALMLGSLGLIGHAAMLEGPSGWLSRASHVLHLLAAGFWLGSLVPLVLCLKGFGDASSRVQVSTALRRFSGLGHFAVGIVIGTGALNTLLVLGAVPIQASSPYQSMLLAKIALVGVMVALAIVNRYVLVPSLETDGRTLQVLRTCTVAELLLGISVLAIVSVLGILPPT